MANAKRLMWLLAAAFVAIEGRLAPSGREWSEQSVTLTHAAEKSKDFFLPPLCTNPHLTPSFSANRQSKQTMPFITGGEA